MAAFETFPLKTGVRADLCANSFPSRLSVWQRDVLRLEADATHFGFVFAGGARLSDIRYSKEKDTQRLFFYTSRTRLGKWRSGVGAPYFSVADMHLRLPLVLPLRPQGNAVPPLG